MIAYLRDFGAFVRSSPFLPLSSFVILPLLVAGVNYSFIAESFETSAPWDAVVPLCNNGAYPRNLCSHSLAVL